MSALSDVLDRLSKIELLALARAAELPGRSSMTKPQLQAALLERLGPAEPKADGAATRRRRCVHRSDAGHPCGLDAYQGHDRCPLHGAVDLADLAVPVAGRLGFDTWPQLIRQLALASYDTDPLGLDPVIADMIWHVTNFVYREYFRVTVVGAGHVPESGPAMLVANHAGAALPWDGLMLTLAVANEAPQPRRVRSIGTEIFNMLPWISHLYRKSGAAYASREDARWILDRGHVLAVFPEGVAGFQKSQHEAYQTKRFGRGGFVEMAMRTGTPIVPVAIVGSEETHPVLFTSKRLAQVVRAVFPQQRVEQMAVWLNPIPLPVKWTIEFLEPIEMGPPADRIDRLAVLEVAEEVRARIQAALDRIVGGRTGIF